MPAWGWLGPGWLLWSVTWLLLVFKTPPLGWWDGIWRQAWQLEFYLWDLQVVLWLPHVCSGMHTCTHMCTEQDISTKIFKVPQFESLPCVKQFSNQKFQWAFHTLSNAFRWELFRWGRETCVGARLLWPEHGSCCGKSSGEISGCGVCATAFLESEMEFILDYMLVQRSGIWLPASLETATS